MSDKDGGPAFPLEATECKGCYGSEGKEGMTLRDYFAAKVIFGFLETEDNTFDWAAKRAYKYADAMLEARKK